MIVLIVRQPFCVLAVDSAQARNYDFTDFSKTAYRIDAEKLHAKDGLVVAEGGNHQIFSTFHRRLTTESDGSKSGIEAALKKAPTLMSRSARAWEMETKFKWPKLDKEILRDARNSFSVIAGWSEKRRKIIAGTVGDDPTYNSLAPENGYLLQCAGEQTRKTIEAYLKNALFPIQKNPLTPEQAMDVCRKCIADAEALEDQASIPKRIGGPARIAIIQENSAPRIIID